MDRVFPRPRSVYWTESEVTSFSETAKRRMIVDAIIRRREAKRKALQDNPGLDISVREVFEEPCDRKTVTIEVSRVPDHMLDALIAHHCPGEIGRTKYVW